MCLNPQNLQIGERVRLMLTLYKGRISEPEYEIVYYTARFMIDQVTSVILNKSKSIDYIQPYLFQKQYHGDSSQIFALKSIKAISLHKMSMDCLSLPYVKASKCLCYILNAKFGYFKYGYHSNCSAFFHGIFMLLRIL